MSEVFLDSSCGSSSNTKELFWDLYQKHCIKLKASNHNNSEWISERNCPHVFIAWLKTESIMVALNRSFRLYPCTSAVHRLIFLYPLLGINTVDVFITYCCIIFQMKAIKETNPRVRSLPSTSSREGRMTRITTPPLQGNSSGILSTMSCWMANFPKRWW